MNPGRQTHSRRICKIVIVALLVAFFVGNAAMAQTQHEAGESKSAELLALETKLNELLEHYTEFNPEVVRLRQQIQLLKEGRGDAVPNQSGSQLSPATKNTNGPAAEKVALSSNAPVAARVIPLPATESGAKPEGAITNPVGEVKTPVPPLSSTSSAPSASITATDTRTDTVPAAVSALPPTASARTITSSTPSTTTERVSSQSGVSSEIAKSTKAEPKKGPIFSPLPPDLSPTNQAAASKSAAAKPDANKSMETLDEQHLLAIGDRISFRIVEDEEESKSLLVADSGEIEIPNNLGRFAATGKSCKELANVVKAELEKEYYFHATVMIAVDLMARTRGKVYIVGAVGRPGPVDIPSDEVLTVSKAILYAGDFTGFGDKKKVKVTRKSRDGGDQTFIVNVADVLEKGRKETDLPLEAGDLIYVGEKVFRL